MSSLAVRPAGRHRATARPAPAPAAARRIALVPTAMLLLGALYCLLPVAWVVIAATKSGGELFSTFTFAAGHRLLPTTSAT